MGPPPNAGAPHGAFATRRRTAAVGHAADEAAGVGSRIRRAVAVEFPNLRRVAPVHFARRPHAVWGWSVTGCAALAGAALVRCLAADPGCLPAGTPPNRVAWLAVTVEQESGPRGPWAIRNETTRRSRWFPTREEAEREALRLHARGDVLGLGPAQVTHEANWRRFGLADAAGRPVRAFDLCLNLRAALAHQAEDAARAVRLAVFRQYNGGPRAAAPGAVPAADAYALRVEELLARSGAAAPVPAATPIPPRPCVPSWDVWARCKPETPPGAESPPSAAPVALSGRLATEAPE